MKTLFTLSFFVFVLCSTTITAKAQVDINDSLALVDLYNNTNGPNWYNHSNWLTGPVKDWYGITLDGNRVIWIHLYGNNLSGKLSSSLGDLSSLLELVLYGNQLSGNIPPKLGNLSKLYSLSLSNNQLNGSIPPELGNLSNLVSLNLSNNQLSGNIPSELGNLSQLYSIYLSNNQLSGSIPSALGNLSSLHDLVLPYNQLTGSIPPELGNLAQLSGLDLSHNKLSSSIPPEIVNSITLYSLDLSHNKLSGSIPSSIGNLSNIAFLSLDHNQLSGSIPGEISNLSSLLSLTLNHNKLSGAIPSINILYFYALYLNDNQFTFEGMEAVAKKYPAAKYNDQERIPVHVNNNTLSVSAGGTLSRNTYLWFKKVDKEFVRLKGDSSFHPTESGIYVVRIKNAIATELDLYSNNVYYTAPVTANVITSDKTEISNEGFSVYPNPAKDVVHVTTNGSASFSLVSKTGKILFTTTISKAGTINVSRLPAGDYYLTNNNTNVSKKVVVIK